jgi:pyruvate dehydrogenase E2 component (dihydrolipoamide acetyltransferase)
MTAVKALRMPKWGLSMREGTIVEWWIKEGSRVAEGDELLDIETSKITNVFEAPEGGTLRRIVAKPGETLPVGALIAVLGESNTTDSEVDSFIEQFQANFKPEEALEEGAGALSLETVDIGGATLQLGRAGGPDGVPIVLLHGFSGDMNSWLFNIETLASKGPILAFDLPGHGGSSKDVADGSLGTLAERIVSALDKLGVGKAHFVGHSLGAAIAARIAADHAGRVASLTLICPASLPGNRISEEFLTGVVEAQRARELKPFVEMLFFDPSLVTREMIDDMIKFKRIDRVEDALAKIRDRLVEGSDAAALAADLHKIPKATIIASRADQIVGAPNAGALPSTFRIHWIENAGHMPHLDHAAEVNAILAESVG